MIWEFSREQTLKRGLRNSDVGLVIVVIRISPAYALLVGRFEGGYLPPLTMRSDILSTEGTDWLTGWFGFSALLWNSDLSFYHDLPLS